MKKVWLIASIMMVLAMGLLPNTDAQSQQGIQKRSGPKPSPFRLIATDIEVSQFFNHYIERYTKKDLEGLMRLFSPKVLQNQRAEVDDIRESYSQFFNESLTLQLGIEDQKVEIYENAAEVKARYKVEQIVKKSGKRKVLRGHIRWVLTREDGELKILSVDYQHEKPIKAGGGSR